jgi:hypothetical protein
MVVLRVSAKLKKKRVVKEDAEITARRVTRKTKTVVTLVSVRLTHASHHHLHLPRHGLLVEEAADEAARDMAAVGKLTA